MIPIAAVDRDQGTVINSDRTKPAGFGLGLELALGLGLLLLLAVITSISVQGVVLGGTPALTESGESATCPFLQAASLPISTSDQDMILRLEIGMDRLAPGAATVITATVLEPSSQPVSDTLVVFFGSFGVVSPANALSNSVGEVTATFTAGGIAGKATVTTLAGYAFDSGDIQIVGSQVPPLILPGNPEPVGEATAVPLTQTLRWQGNPATDPVAYFVAFGRVDPPPIVANSVMGTEFKPALLLPNSHYYWAITATNGLSTTAGPVWQFTTGANFAENRIYLPLVVRNADAR